MTKTLTEQWAVITPENCQEINNMISGYKKKIERLQEQLNEANKVVKFYAETTVGHKRKDGTYGMWICSGEVAWENPLERIKSRMDYICYDPIPAKKWLKKWGAK